jgi:hypothetical protein
MDNAKLQAERLMNDLVEFAERMLRDHGEFHPFGGYLKEHEGVIHVGLSTDVKWASGSERERALADSFRLLARQNSVLVFGIVTNVSFEQPTQKNNAIRVFLEHRSGYCADVFLSYHLQAGAGPKINEIAAQPGSPRLFVNLGS